MINAEGRKRTQLGDASCDEIISLRSRIRTCGANVTVGMRIPEFYQITDHQLTLRSHEIAKIVID